MEHNKLTKYKTTVDSVSPLRYYSSLCKWFWTSRCAVLQDQCNSLYTLATHQIDCKPVSHINHLWVAFPLSIIVSIHPPLPPPSSSSIQWIAWIWPSWTISHLDHLRPFLYLLQQYRYGTCCDGNRELAALSEKKRAELQTRDNNIPADMQGLRQP